MRFSGRGYYNYLRRQPQEGVAIKDFRVRDYRAISRAQLIRDLLSLGVELPEGGFKVASEDFDSPEEMVESLDTVSMQKEKKEEIYLYFFELWRRENTDKPSISIFFDELDRVIDLYLTDQKSYEEKIIELFADLLMILESLTERVKRDEAIFRTLMHYSSHDLEAVIYNFIFDLLQQKEFVQASEFIEGFTRFMKDKRWFEFLRIKSLDNPHADKVLRCIDTLMQSLEKKKDFYLVLALLNYFNEANLLDFFVKLYVKALSIAKTEDEYRELQETLFTYFTLNDDEKRASQVLEMIEKKEGRKEVGKILHDLVSR